MPLRFVRQLRNNTAQSLVLSVKLGAPLARRRCGSSSVFEVAHYVYKYTSNECSFRVHCTHPQENDTLCLLDDFESFGFAASETSLVDRRSGAKSFIVMMPTNSVYCHKSHSHFALLIAQKIFAIILRLPLILFVSFARLSA